MKVVLRPMEPGDIRHIAAWMASDQLWQRYGLSPERVAADFERGLARGDLLLVVDSASPAQGFAWCLLDGMFGAFPYLKRFGVDPAATGDGLGGRLLVGLEQALIDQHRQELFLLVSDFNSGAQRFYQRHGYQQIGWVPDLVLPGVTELIFRKLLPGLS